MLQINGKEVNRITLGGVAIYDRDAQAQQQTETASAACTKGDGVWNSFFSGKPSGTLRILKLTGKENLINNQACLMFSDGSSADVGGLFRYRNGAYGYVQFKSYSDAVVQPGDTFIVEEIAL